MQIHSIQRKTKNRKVGLVGRGGKRGKTSGRGTKGQKARAGHKIRPEIRDFIKTLPKLRGRGKNSFQSFQVPNAPVNLHALDVFAVGETVSPKTLVEKNIVSKTGGKYPKVKILGTGEISKSVTIEGCSVSKEARAKIEKAGGKVA